MTASFKRIDYSLRPAKYAERRMIRDIFRRLSPFDHPESYHYVGFGSVWFSDFVLFHRGLGVRKMLSIESSRGAERRIRDNLPFQIELQFDRAARVLPKLDWNDRKFVWLDYDDALTPEMLRDARHIARKCRSGSLLAVTVRCSAAKEVDQANSDDSEGSLSALERFHNTFRDAQVPAETGEDDLTGWPFAALARQILLSEIESALALRNGDGADDPFEFRHVCSFNYADGAWMTTLVGLIVCRTDGATADMCDFASLDFVLPDGAPFFIEIPKLTSREVRALEEQFPAAADVELDLGSIPTRDAEIFASIYRYLPSFAVLEN